jgi:hypothetical protein
VRPEVDPGGERDRSVWASERVYRALIRLYPEEVRRRYAEEMVGYFGDLCREEWHSRGAKGMVLLWARTLPDLVFSVLKERGTNFLRGAYLPVAPEVVARLGALSALLGGSLGVALILVYTLAISYQLNWLLDSVWVTMPVLTFATLLSVLGTFGLYGTLVARSGRPGVLALSGVTLAALSAVSFLALYAYTTAEMLGWLWPEGEGMSWWEMTRDVILLQIATGSSALGLLLLGVSAFRASLFGRLRALPLAVAPLWPASTGLLTLPNGFGMLHYALFCALPFLGAALLGRVMLEHHPTERAVAAGGVPGSASEVENHQSTSGERATPATYRPQRKWTVPRVRADWLLVALSVLLMCVGAYAVRDTLLKTFGVVPAGASMGPLSDESQRLGRQKTAGGARVTLKRAYAEEKVVVVGVVVEDLEGDRSIAGHPAGLEPDFRLTDESGTEFRLDSFRSQEATTDAPKYHKLGFKAGEALEPAEKHRFRLEVSLVEWVLPSRDFWGPDGEERPPPEPVGKPLVFDFQIPVRGAPVVEVGEKDTASGVTLTLDRVIDSPGKSEAFVCYEAPDDEHTWSISGGEGTYAAGAWGTKITGVPPAECQRLQLEGPLEGRTLVEVTSLEGLPYCRAVRAEVLEACDKKIRDRTIGGPWRFEFEVPDSAGGARPPREAGGGGGGT